MSRSNRWGDQSHSGWCESQFQVWRRWISHISDSSGGWKWQVSCWIIQLEFNKNVINFYCVCEKVTNKIISIAGNLEIVKILIQNRVNVNAKDYFNRSAIHLAARKGILTPTKVRRLTMTQKKMLVLFLQHEQILLSF